MNTKNSSFPVGIDFRSVLEAISKQIYETPHAFIRENVQNAVDAVRIQSLRDGNALPNENYHIDITIDGNVLTVRDNGIGMSEADLQDYFWTVGASGKRGKEAIDAGCIGMFGIGGFANFGVCRALEVTSQIIDGETGTMTRLSVDDIKSAGSRIPSVTVKESQDAGPRGTIVTGYMNNEPNTEDLKTYLSSFVRYVPISIRFNNELISQKLFTDVDDKENLTPIGDEKIVWSHGTVGIAGRLFEDRGNTLVVLIEELIMNNQSINLKGQLRLENGYIDVFKRGFKLCATQIASTIGVSGRLDCDLFVPTAGRDSLEANTMSLLSQIAELLEINAIDTILESNDRISQHTRIFRRIIRLGLIDKLDNVIVSLSDGGQVSLKDIRQRAKDDKSVFFGTRHKQDLNQAMQARGHIVVMLSGDRYRREAEKKYLEKFCGARPFDGIIDCAEVYADLTRFELAFLSGLETNVFRSYEIEDIHMIAGRLTEDIPVFVKERSGNKPIDYICGCPSWRDYQTEGAWIYSIFLLTYFRILFTIFRSFA